MRRACVSLTHVAKNFLQHNQQQVRGVKSLQTFGSTDKRITDRFFALPGATDHTFHTYIWIDGTGEGLRAKTRVAQKKYGSVNEIPPWAYDGSSTFQAAGENSDMLLKPVAWCRDPFFLGDSKLVMCETFDGAGKPSRTNLRSQCIEAVEKTKHFEPWFAFEQEYTLVGYDGRPLGFPVIGFPEPQGPYYCSVGGGCVAGRDISDTHMLACLYAGLPIEGTNAEVLLGQWEYQVGPSGGIEICDQLWLSRYILERISEEFGVSVSLDPK
uniref:glutamine synthetase n=1 Tax=Plectus sambesii TaxID=2011161 RepID=A0A914VTU6_9BILA